MTGGGWMEGPVSPRPWPGLGEEWVGWSSGAPASEMSPRMHLGPWSCPGEHRWSMSCRSECCWSSFRAGVSLGRCGPRWHINPAQPSLQPACSGLIIHRQLINHNLCRTNYFHTNWQMLLIFFLSSFCLAFSSHLNVIIWQLFSMYLLATALWSFNTVFCPCPESLLEDTKYKWDPL